MNLLDLLTEHGIDLEVPSVLAYLDVPHSGRLFHSPKVVDYLKSNEFLMDLEVADYDVQTGLYYHIGLSEFALYLLYDEETGEFRLIVGLPQYEQSIV